MKKKLLSNLILLVLFLSVSFAQTPLLQCGIHEAQSEEEIAQFFEWIYLSYEEPSIALMKTWDIRGGYETVPRDVPATTGPILGPAVGSEWIFYDGTDGGAWWFEREATKIYRYRRHDITTGLSGGYWVLLGERPEITDTREVIRDARTNWTDEDRALFEIFGRFVYVCDSTS